MSKEKLREAILGNIDQDLYDGFFLPHIGFVPDWYPRYMRLKDLIEEYLDEPRSPHPHEG